MRTALGGKRRPLLAAALCWACAAGSLAAGWGPSEQPPDDRDYGNHNLEWEDGPASWEEFGHGNDPSVCGLEFLTVEEWEAGRYWEKGKPVIVRNVTDGWAALRNWRKQEMLRLYPDAEATMGEGRLVGETGPDDAGKNLQPTTVKEFITKHMYNPLKYFFDRKIAIPKGMLQDCEPFPMPTRAYLVNPDKGSLYAPAKKRRVRTTPDRELWRDHLAISIGSDLQGLTFHHHREAWNVVVFGAKRWILWDHDRWKDNNTMQWRLTRDWAGDAHVSGAEWIRRLYPEPDRTREIREHGHDCMQGPGEMMFVPHRWMHMVVNVGDTVSVISEVGLGIGEGKKPEDFLYDPDASSDDGEGWSEDGGGSGDSGPFEGDEEGWDEEWDEEWYSEDWSGDDERGWRYRGRAPEYHEMPPEYHEMPPEYRERPPPGWVRYEGGDFSDDSGEYWSGDAEDSYDDWSGDGEWYGEDELWYKGGPPLGL